MGNKGSLFSPFEQYPKDIESKFKSLEKVEDTDFIFSNYDESVEIELQELTKELLKQAEDMDNYFGSYYANIKAEDRKKVLVLEGLLEKETRKIMCMAQALYELDMNNKEDFVVTPERLNMDQYLNETLLLLFSGGKGVL